MGVAGRKMLWLVLLALLVVTAYICFQAYLSPGFLINFGNAWLC